MSAARWPVIAAAALLLAAGSTPHASVDQAAAPDWRPVALQTFDVVWDTINSTFYDPNFGGVDWNAIRREFRPRVERAASPDDTRAIIREMLARLGKSHMALLSAAPDSLAPSGPAAVPIDVRVAADEVVITRVIPDSNASRAGVRAGDRLDGVDGEQARDWFAAAQGDTPRARDLDVWRRATRALHGLFGVAASLQVRAPGAAESRRLEVSRVMAPGAPVKLGNLPPLSVEVDARETKTQAGRRVGIVAFNIWMPAINVPVANAVDKYRGADGLVIDLRGNPGGLADMIRGVAGQIIDDGSQLLGRMQMRGVPLEFKPNPRRSTPDGRAVTPYAGPVAVLVDELTASASECFAGAMQSLGRARIFGRQTMGQALPASTKQLPNGDVLLHVVGDFVTSNGKSLEGDGVIPDELVPLDRAALAAGRDPALAAALAWVDSYRRFLPF